MTQLSDDCFATGEAPMTVAEAARLIAARIEPVSDIEAVPLAAAFGRVLAADLPAPHAVPPHDSSAVDGYAIRHADLVGEGETRLAVGGRVAAGHPLGRAQRPGEAIRIFTGAMLPVGVDTVMMQEDCIVDGDHVRLAGGIRPGANRRLAGEDVPAGAVALRAGRRLRPQDVGMAAAVGADRLDVRRRLSAALFSTGDEIRPPGGPLPPGAVYDSNRYILAALLAGMGVVVDDLGILPDRLDAIAPALAGAAGAHDLIVTSGGMSVGEEDHVRAAVAAAGRLDFWRLAIRPGRPVALGRIGEAIFVGLPGNPVSVMVAFMAVARPILLARMGAAPEPPRAFPVRLGFDWRKKAGRREYLRARLEDGPDGLPLVRKFPRDGVGILSSMVESDGLVALDEDATELVAGTLVDFLPFSELMR
ncbi:molybdopterin molybdotransferase [Stella humosa]|uniref:Molybdopterin molybdenumtransferase n=1 Tax=Stella humosa TaxID=94 RepID=A0A3N1KY03_9PROT|nr:gephyrin-like molybdotransferase Glp [Stella humosa]ROP84077.1 molybdopterin molybdotransferase [Stella humosa]BBK33589.1 molybdopterin molybdenumtransferase MoeA [Stella humosa]